MERENKREGGCSWVGHMTYEKVTETQRYEDSLHLLIQHLPCGSSCAIVGQVPANTSSFLQQADTPTGGGGGRGAGSNEQRQIKKSDDFRLLGRHV